MATQYEQFRELTDGQYDGCSDKQKIALYLQHRPAAAVPFLLELMLELSLVEEQNDDDTE